MLVLLGSPLKALIYVSVALLTAQSFAAARWLWPESARFYIYYYFFHFYLLVAILKFIYVLIYLAVVYVVVLSCLCKCAVVNVRARVCVYVGACGACVRAYMCVRVRV